LLRDFRIIQFLGYIVLNITQSVLHSLNPVHVPTFRKGTRRLVKYARACSGLSFLMFPNFPTSVRIH
jgi:hypothetical protein